MLQLSGKLELDGRLLEVKLAVPHAEVERASQEPTLHLCVGSFQESLMTPSFLSDIKSYFCIFGNVLNCIPVLDSMDRGFIILSFGIILIIL